MSGDYDNWKMRDPLDPPSCDMCAEDRLVDDEGVCEECRERMDAAGVETYSEWVQRKGRLGYVKQG